MQDAYTRLLQFLEIVRRPCSVIVAGHAVTIVHTAEELKATLVVRENGRLVPRARISDIGLLLGAVPSSKNISFIHKLVVADMKESNDLGSDKIDVPRVMRMALTYAVAVLRASSTIVHTGQILFVSRHSPLEIDIVVARELFVPIQRLRIPFSVCVLALGTEIDIDSLQSLVLAGNGILQCVVSELDIGDALARIFKFMSRHPRYVRVHAPSASLADAFTPLPLDAEERDGGERWVSSGMSVCAARIECAETVSPACTSVPEIPRISPDVPALRHIRALTDVLAPHVDSISIPETLSTAYEDLRWDSKIVQDRKKYNESIARWAEFDSARRVYQTRTLRTVVDIMCLPVNARADARARVVWDPSAAFLDTERKEHEKPPVFLESPSLTLRTSSYVGLSTDAVRDGDAPLVLPLVQRARDVTNSYVTMCVSKEAVRIVEAHTLNWENPLLVIAPYVRVLSDAVCGISELPPRLLCDVLRTLVLIMPSSFVRYVWGRFVEDRADPVEWARGGSDGSNGSNGSNSSNGSSRPPKGSASGRYQTDAVCDELVSLGVLLACGRDMGKYLGALTRAQNKFVTREVATALGEDQKLTLSEAAEEEEKIRLEFDGKRMTKRRRLALDKALARVRRLTQSCEETTAGTEGERLDRDTRRKKLAEEAEARIPDDTLLRFEPDADWTFDWMDEGQRVWGEVCVARGIDPEIVAAHKSVLEVFHSVAEELVRCVPPRNETVERLAGALST